MCHLLTHNGFHVFYNSNPITMFHCAPFSDIQALGHDFPNFCFSAIVNDLHLYFVFGHIANKFNVILSIVKEVIIFPEKGDLFRIGKTNMNTLRPKYDVFPS